MTRRAAVVVESMRSDDAKDARRIGIVSDSHGSIDPRILAQLAACDLVIHAGDVGGPEVLTALAPACVVAVRGNNDTPQRWGGAQPDLPELAMVKLFNGVIVVIHGHQYPRAAKRHEQLRARFPDAVAIVYGHSHRSCVDDAEQPRVINPGACGRARTFGGPSMILLSRRRNRWHIEQRRFPPTGR